MTRSALANTFGGIVSPICFAAFRLMMNSNFFGCSTGRSAGLGAFQYFVHVGGGAPVQVGNAHAVAHKPTGFHIFSPVVYRREPALYREVGNLFSVRIEDGARQHKDCVSTPLRAARNAVSISLGSSTSRY